jgi:hypothetical protein
MYVIDISFQWQPLYYLITQTWGPTVKQNDTQHNDVKLNDVQHNNRDR